LSHYM